MKIEQFENKPLAQFSYAVLSEETGKIILIDPARDPEPYYAFAREHRAVIAGIIETHPHADFISSHREISETTGATIFTSSRAGAVYPHRSPDHLSEISMGELELRALDTPGHSPDSISIVLAINGTDHAVFTGDTLFLGDCGRPDLREKAGVNTATPLQLAKSMYHTLREVLGGLGDDVIVYPAHGAGSLCGKSLKAAHSGTIGEEKSSNWSMQEMSEPTFISRLMADQPFIPAYFQYDVEMNLLGAANFQANISRIPLVPQPATAILQDSLIVDTRDQRLYKAGHLKNSVNLMAGGAFETWLGTLIAPYEFFYLTAENEQSLRQVISRAAMIGYENFIKGAFVFEKGYETLDTPELNSFKASPEAYTIVDVRNDAEVNARKIFPGSLHIPLAELNQRWDEIPLDRPVVVHCAGGYRSAAASSILQGRLQHHTTVYDLGEAIKQF